MAEDWDLYAVVRSCSSATDPGPSTITNDAQNTAIRYENGDWENPLSCLATLTFEEEDDPFCLANLVESRNNGSGDLQDSYKPFLPHPTTTIRSQGIVFNSSISGLGGFNGHNQQQQEQQNQLQRQNQSTTTTTSISPPLTPILAFGESKNQQRPQHVQQQQLGHQHQQFHHQEVQKPGTSSAVPLRTLQSQAPRSRKRKNQQKRTVCHVTAENLSADLWAWRKYGQKPIKGSPYPRNYYRCSSSKGCAARKQVERSNTDPNIFIVTYSGDHTHPRPTHRNSLAGSTRNKFSTIHKPGSADSEPEPPPIIANASCSSPLSSRSLSPATPLPAPEEQEMIMIQNDNKTTDGAEDEKEEAYDNDEAADLLIPNMAMNEDLFMGLQQLGSSIAGGAVSTAGDSGLG